MKSFHIILLETLFLLAACTPVQPTPETFVTATLPPTTTPWPTPNMESATATPTTDPSRFSPLFPGSNAGNEFTRNDEQGMVVVEVTPLNLGMPADTLEFEVRMNTHSVDLNMDLALLSTLITDTGILIQPTLWDAPRGGHHISGKLFFPAQRDGEYVLNNAGNLTLHIRDVNAPVRTFTWELP